MLINVAEFFTGESAKVNFCFPVKAGLPSDIVDMQDLTVNGVMTKTKGVITFSGKAFTTYRVYCARCLEITESKLSFEFNDNFVLSSEVDNKGLCKSESLREDDDFFVYDGGFIDLTDAVNANIILNLPFKVVCNDDCKGLCRVCGANLNIDECQCDLSFGNVFSGISHLFSEDNNTASPPR